MLNPAAWPPSPVPPGSRFVEGAGIVPNTMAVTVGWVMPRYDAKLRFIERVEGEGGGFVRVHFRYGQPSELMTQSEYSRYCADIYFHQSVGVTGRC